MLVRESKDSPVGDDDKIYYFFTERAGEETTSFFDKSQVARVARVARVCKVGMSPATGSQVLLLLAAGVVCLHLGRNQGMGRGGHTTPPAHAEMLPVPSQSDVGGKKILQRKWTSFMKARLVCYIPYYEVLRSVCSLDGGGWTSTVFYAAFTLSAQW